jgi:citrate lyase subunit beta-like protein
VDVSHTNTLVPGSEERKIRSSFSLKADCLVYDLEDSVALGRKGAARSQVYDALQASPSQEDRKGQELAVRINAVASGMALDDLGVTVGGMGGDVWSGGRGS